MGSERKIKLYVPYKAGIHRDGLTDWKISNGINRRGSESIDVSLKKLWEVIPLVKKWWELFGGQIRLNEILRSV